MNKIGYQEKLKNSPTRQDKEIPTWKKKKNVNNSATALLKGREMGCKAFKCRIFLLPSHDYLKSKILKLKRLIRSVGWLWNNINAKIFISRLEDLLPKRSTRGKEIKIAPNQIFQRLPIAIAQIHFKIC